ncbi:carotenoid biosynthesis protein [bacterium]|nr:carotenoid biosynthesis protein [bacterium]
MQADKLGALVRSPMIWLVALHSIGAASALWAPEPYRSWVVGATPVHLAVVVGLMALGEPRPLGAFGRAVGLCLAYGYALEWIGVHTGWPFGDYRYGNALGPKLMGVPIIIGLNWFVVSVSVRQWIPKYPGRWWRVLRHPVVFSALAALGMVGLDALIEPVAPKLDYWYWAHGTAPIQNFLGWFAGGWILQVFLQSVLPLRANQVALWTFPIQVIFFVLLNWFL